MAILDQIISGGVSSIIESVGGVLDKFITSDEEKLQAKQAISDLVISKLTDIASYQRDALVAELQGNSLQRNWRPLVMLAFAFIIVFHYFLQPVLGHWWPIPNIDLPDQFWNLLEIGMGGYVIGRSVEKVADTVTKNVDLTFIPKRKRDVNDVK
jgi:hypothetical protein